MNMPQCLITARDLVVLPNKWVHGDLHQVGNSYVFNACLDDRGGAAWQFGEPRDRRSLVLVSEDVCYEKRGVIVVSVSDAALNEEAARYLAGRPS